MPGQPTKLTKVKEIGRKDILLSVARVPKTPRLYAGSSDSKVYEFDVSAAKPEVGEFAGHSSYVTGVALAGDVLVSGSYDQKLIWWDREKRTPIRTVENAHAKWIRAVVASPDGNTIATVGDDMVCRLWDAKTGEKRLELRGHEERTPTHFPSMLFTCCFTADGKTLAAGGIGKIGNIDHLDGKARVEVFDWHKAARLWEFESDKIKGLVERLAFHPKGDWLLAAGGANDGFLMFLDVKAKKPLKQEKAPAHVHDFALNEASDTLYTVGHGRVVVFTLKG